MASKAHASPPIWIDVARLRAHPEPHKIMLLPVQVAALTGVPTGRLAQMRRSGRGPGAEKFGRHLLYRLPEVLEWLDATKVEEVRHGA